MSYWLRAWGPPGRPTSEPSCAEISPELVVGEYLLPSDVPWLVERLRVQAVLSLQNHADLVAKNIDRRALEQAFHAHGVAFNRIPVTDGSHREFLSAIDPAVSWIARQAAGGRRVYLHCNAGINRAPTVAIAYLRVSRGIPLAEARRWVQEQRACVPYWTVLETWERSRSD